MIAAIHQHESVQKKKNGNGQATTVPSVQTVQSTFPQNESEGKQEEVAATFQTTTNNTNNTNFRGNYRGSNYRGNQNQTYCGAGNGYRGTNPNRGGAGAGYRPNYNQANNSTNANTNNSGKTCIFCRKPNHIQDFCRARISQNAPCIDNQGKTYWPKVHANEEISSSSVFFLEN